MPDKISIITVCFNAANSIERTILSVINQDYPNIEYIIIDGRSTDGTQEIIRKYEDKINYWISEKDCGIYDAMNKGIAIATGDWIHFKNCGDIFPSQNVLSQIFLKKHEKSVSIIHGNCLYDKGWCIKSLKPDLTIDAYISRMPIFHCSCFILASLHKEMPFDLKYRQSSDYDFIYKCYSNNLKFKYIPLDISTFALNGVSTINWKKSYIEDKMIQGHIIKRVPLSVKAKHYYKQIKERIIRRNKLLQAISRKSHVKTGWQILNSHSNSEYPFYF